MSIKNKYNIRPISYKEAMKMAIKYHYLHRKAPCSFSFGLFDQKRLIGIICYGTPASMPLCKGICGPEEKYNVIELTRLWIKDNTPKNVESFLIGNTIKLIDKEIIVSYAEADMGHIGIVYQATNWIYTGLSAKHCKWEIIGEKPKHCRHIFDKYGGVKKAKLVLKDKMIKKDRPRKHRYIYFNCGKKRKKELLKKLRYEIKSYPRIC